MAAAARIRARRLIAKRSSAASPAVAVASKVTVVTPSDLPSVQTTNYRRKARPAQLPPLGQWFIWFILAGRGWGKTWTGASVVNEWARTPGEYIGIVGREADEVRSVMIEGPSGILATSELGFRPKYEPSKKLLTWPNNSRARLFYSEEPRKLRGPNLTKAWGDEPASWKDADKGLTEDTTISNLFFALRESDDPKLLITGTPKPFKMIKQLLDRPNIVVTGGSTYENAENLSQVFFDEVVKPYEGTRLGQQELYAKLLFDNPDAIFKLEWIARDRVTAAPPMKRIVVGVDPNASKEADSETGIVVAGIDFSGQGYVLADRSVGKVTPDEWATVVVDAYWQFAADRIVPEKNNGGDMVESTIKHADRRVPVKPVWASRGKATRAEPVSLLYERGLIHHVGTCPLLEDQMTEWVPGNPSPDRMDALVWALSDLFGLSQSVDPRVINV